jgi:hypothetical protein
VILHIESMTAHEDRRGHACVHSGDEEELDQVSLPHMGSAADGFSLQKKMQPHADGYF